MIFFSILAERMEKIFGEQLHYQIPQDTEIIGCCYWESGIAPEPGFLLLRTCAPTEAAGQPAETVFLECTAKVSDSTDPAVNQISVNGSPKETVFNQASRIISYYENWERTLMTAVMNETSLPEILNLAAEYLCNPIALFDTSITLIHYAGSFTQNPPDRMWDTVWRTGSSLEFYSYEDWKRLYELMNQKNEPFFYGRIDEKTPGEVPASSRNEIMCCPLKYHGQLIGSLGSTIINGPFTMGEIRLISCIKGLLERALVLQSASNRIKTHSFYNLIRYLHGESVEETLLLRYLKIRSWHESDLYQIVCLQRPYSSRENDTFAVPYIDRLQKIFPSGLIFSMEDDIFIILNLSRGTIITEEHKKDLEYFYDRFHLPSGISMPFFHFLNIRSYYSQGKEALKIGIEKKNHRAVFYYEELFPDHLYQKIKEDGNEKSLCMPQILNALEEGVLNTENLRILYTFLLQGCSIQNTANLLNYHRNTLTYRIHKLKQALHMEFEALNSSQRLHVIISCLIALHANMPQSPDGSDVPR